MSKNLDDQEWEDVTEEEEEEEQVDNSIRNPDVVVKYKKAAVWSNETLKVVIAACIPGAKVGELCKLGDDTIEAKCENTFKELTRGIAFPTCISVNHCVCHNSPGKTDDPEGYKVELKEGDIVHIDLSVQIDGYVTQVAHTIQVLTEGKQLNPESKEAKVITAAHQAMNTIIRAFRPDNTLYDVTEGLEHMAEVYGVNPVEGVLSHQLKQYIIDGAKCIGGKNTPQHQVHNYKFETGSVWTLDVVYTTGKGKLKDSLSAKPCIFKLALDGQHSSRTNAADAVKKEAEASYQNFPFSVRSLTTKRARLGISELFRHQVVSSYPPLFEKEGEVVAHFKCTVFITDKKIERLTGLPAQSGGIVLPITDDEILSAIAKSPMSLVEKKKKVASE